MWVFLTFRIPAFRIPVFRIPTFGIPGFRIPTFGILVEIQAPLNQTPLRLPQNSIVDAILSVSLVAQCSATPATVAATPPCSATPFQTPKFRCDTSRHRRGGGGRCDTKIFRGCSATPVLHLQNAIKSRKSAATRVARHV